MALKGTFTPKASLTEAPTNLKEAIDWVLRVTGRDGKGLGDECICGLAAAVTDLLQSVELEYNGYQGDVKNGTDQNKGASAVKVQEHLNDLFSLVQGLGGTAVVRTYIDQLAQVLSALVGWSSIKGCGGGSCNDSSGKGGDSNPHGKRGCEYLEEVERNGSCATCSCIKWEVPVAGTNDKGHHLGRGCTRCSDSGGSEHNCSCSSAGDCQGADKCQCALAGKCCKCCCTNCSGTCKKECICDKEDKSYKSAYRSKDESWIEGKVTATWTELKNDPPGIYHPRPITVKRHQCAQILLGSVCLIWSGLTYMYWTGKYAKGSPRWNNHILDGSGLDDGTLSQWLQALGFPKAMLNDKGPENRLDKVIWDGLSDKLLLGFAKPSGANGYDSEGNTARNPFAMNYAGFVHTAHRDSFNDSAIVFKNGTTSGTTDTNRHKRGALFKLYILSCAYFTGLQNKAPPKAENKTPKTIREVLYWLSALPYSSAYPEIAKHGKKRLAEVLEHAEEKKLKFIQTDRPAPITVDEFNLFAHFQAVTQYCPLVLIGIQGGLRSATKGTKEPAIHSLYANTECHFTYPSVPIQAYNQVVHYIRALFYQLYFLRKQCAVKVALGGKWRECRYGDGVLGKDVVSWMCLGCNPMEHDRKSRVKEMKKTLGGVKEEAAKTISTVIKDLLAPLGNVVVQLGNAQEALERGKEKDHIYQSMVIGLVGALGEVVGALEKVVDVLQKDPALSTEGANNNSALIEAVKKVIEVVLEVVTKLEVGVKKKSVNGEAQKALTEARKELEGAKTALEGAQKDLGNGLNGNLEKAKEKLGEAKKKLESLSNNGNGSLKEMWEKITDEKDKSLKDFIDVKEEKLQVDASKNTVSGFIHKVRVALEALKELAEVNVKGNDNAKYYNLTRIQVIIPAIENMLDMVSSTRCVHCRDHINKCGQKPQSKICEKCHQQYMDGTPSPLQAFLEDRLPGFSCHNTMDELDRQEVEKAEKGERDSTPGSELKYPSAASHLWHSNATGQCCPLPMGFRNSFMSTTTGVTSLPPTGARLYGILYFFCNDNMMQSCVYRLVRVTAALSATTPQVLGDVFGFFRGGIGNKEEGEDKEKKGQKTCDHKEDPKDSQHKDKYFCGWCASGLRDEVKKIEWIPKGTDDGGKYRETVGTALINIKGSDSTASGAPQSTTTSLSALTDGNHYVSPLTGELYTAVSATFGHVYLQWVLYLSDSLYWGLESLASEFQQIECRGCRECDPNKCKKGEHGQRSSTGSAGLCQCQSIVSCTGVLPVLYRHGFSYGNPFNLEGFKQENKEKGQYDITKDEKTVKHCHEFLESLQDVINQKEEASQSQDTKEHPLTELLKQVGQLQYDIRLPWIFVLTIAWLVAVLYLAFGAIWPLDWTHMRSHWLRGGEHQWQCICFKKTS